MPVGTWLADSHCNHGCWETAQLIRKLPKLVETLGNLSLVTFLALLHSLLFLVSNIKSESRFTKAFCLPATPHPLPVSAEGSPKSQIGGREGESLTDSRREAGAGQISILSQTISGVWRFYSSGLSPLYYRKGFH